MGLKSMHAEKQSEQPQQSVQDNSLIISIHALLAESDSKSAQNSGALLRI